jgi:hypothetical protein
MGVAGWWGRQGWGFLITLALMFLFMLVLGWQITGRPSGILINERKLMSLSRFQLAIWTIIVLSAYLSVALSRMKASATDPLAIGVDWHLWALLGISTTSLVGTPLLLSAKQAKEPAAAVVPQAASALEEPEDEIKKNRDGLLYGNENINDAHFTDMFEGDELKTTAYIDVSKVQMFFFTVIAVLTYAAAVFKAFRETEPLALDQLPAVSDGLVALLGISHAGYLAGKAVVQTKTP